MFKCLVMREIKRDDLDEDGGAGGVSEGGLMGMAEVGWFRQRGRRREIQMSTVSLRQDHDEFGVCQNTRVMSSLAWKTGIEALPDGDCRGGVQSCSGVW